MVDNYYDPYPEIPSANSFLKTGIKNKSASSRTGKNIVLLGTAIDGPVMEPIPVYDYEDAESIFGPYYNLNNQTPNGATLTRHLKRLFSDEVHSPDNITLMRVSGQKAEGKIPLYPQRKQELVHEQVLVGTANGNVETKFDLQIPDGEHSVDGEVFNEAQIEVVSIEVNGTPVRVDDVLIDKDNGIVILEEGATDSNADVIIEYKLIHIKYIEVENEVANKTSEQLEYKLENTDLLSEGFQIDVEPPEDIELQTVEEEDYKFILPEKNILESSFTLTVKDQIEETTELTADDFTLNSEDGIVELEQEVFDPAEDTLLIGNYSYMTGSPVVKLVIKNTETEHELNEGVDYFIDLEQGLINILANFYDPELEDIVVSYSYLEPTEADNEFYGKAEGNTEYLYLEHIADSTQPLEVIVDGEVIDSELYTINYMTADTTIVNLNPGAIRKGKSIYVSYYWNKLAENKHFIDVKSIYGSSLYNNVIIEIKDNLVIRKNRYEVYSDLQEPVEMNQVPGKEYQFLFPNQEKSIVEGSVVLLVENALEETTQLQEGEFVLNSSTGYVTIGEDYFDPAEETLLVESYAYKEAKEELVTTVRGEYNAQENEFIGEILNRQSKDRVSMRHRYIVPDSLDVVVVRDGSEIPVVENEDYYVNYSKGELVFEEGSSVYPLEVKDKIKANEYKYYNVNSKTITIKKPAEKSTDTQRVFSFEIGTRVNSISELLTAINQSSNNNVIQTRISEELFSMDAMELETPDLKLSNNEDIGTLRTTEIRLRHGQDGINLSKEDLYKALEGERSSDGNLIRPGAYDVLFEYDQARYIVPLGVYADDELSGDRDFAQQLSNFTKRAFLSNNDLFGIIGTKPLVNPTQLEKIAMVNKLEQLNTTFYLQNEEGTAFVKDKKGNSIDSGRSISIVQYDLRIYDETLGMPVIESGAVNFAGIASKLSKTNSTTNETIGIGELAYRLSASQQSRLLANKLITAKITQGEPRVVDGRTCALPDSGWETFQSVHIAYNIVDDINRVFDRYIGRGNSLAKRNSLECDIDNLLKEDPAIVDYEFELRMSSQDQQIGRMLVPLAIVPIGEFRKIYTMISRNEEL